MARINIDRLFFAVVTQDDKSGLVFSKPEYIPTIRELNAKLKANTEKLYAEGRVLDQDTSLEDIEIDFDLADFTNDQQAKYLGHHIATEGGVYALDSDIAPYIAILYESTKRGGKKSYRVYYKGKLQEPDDSVKQKEGKTDYQTNKVTATFQPLLNNGMWKYQIDEDDTNAPEDLDTKFFEKVILPTPKTTAA